VLPQGTAQFGHEPNDLVEPVRVQHHAAQQALLRRGPVAEFEQTVPSQQQHLGVLGRGQDLGEVVDRLDPPVADTWAVARLNRTVGSSDTSSAAVRSASAAGTSPDSKANTPRLARAAALPGSAVRAASNAEWAVDVSPDSVAQRGARIGSDHPARRRAAVPGWVMIDPVGHRLDGHHPCVTAPPDRSGQSGGPVFVARGRLGDSRRLVHPRTAR
jgi:hypothetical protein